MGFLLELASVVATSDKHLHFPSFDNSNINPKIHIAPKKKLRATRGHIVQTDLVATKKPMLKYMGPHIGRS